MRREIFSEEHELFREQFRRFAAGRDRAQDRSLERRRASCPARPGSGWARRASSAPTCRRSTAAPGGDFLYDAIIMEELGYVRAHGLMASLHSDICLPYLASYGTEAQKQKFLSPAIAGDCLVAIAMTEPGDGLRPRQQSRRRRSATATTTS